MSYEQVRVTTQMSQFGEVLRQEYETVLRDMLTDTNRWLFGPPNYGPKAPADLVRKYRLTAEGYVAPPSLATRLRRRWAAVSERAALTWGVLRHGDTHECDAW